MSDTDVKPDRSSTTVTITRATRNVGLFAGWLLVATETLGLGQFDIGKLLVGGIVCGGVARAADWLRRAQDGFVGVVVDILLPLGLAFAIAFAPVTDEEPDAAAGATGGSTDGAALSARA